MLAKIKYIFWEVSKKLLKTYTSLYMVNLILHMAILKKYFFLQVLVCRNYRGDVDMSEIEHFMTLLMDKEEEGTLSPILAHGGVRFMWIKHNNLYCILVFLMIFDILRICMII